jgi:hypothetical protein
MDANLKWKTILTIKHDYEPCFLFNNLYSLSIKKLNSHKSKDDNFTIPQQRGEKREIKIGQNEFMYI